MEWDFEHRQEVAVACAGEDYAAFEAIGLQEIKNAVILDVGCSDGFNTHLKFAPYHNIDHVVGLDIDAHAIGLACKRYTDSRFAFVHESFELFPESDLYDVVYFSHVLQFIPDVEAALAKAYRMLTPRGCVLIKTIDTSSRVAYPDCEGLIEELFIQNGATQGDLESSSFIVDGLLGRKCYTLLTRLGFAHVGIATFGYSTAGKAVCERMKLFQRSLYVAKAFAIKEHCVSVELAGSIKRCSELFKREDFYYAESSFVAIGYKSETEESFRNYNQGIFYTAEPAELVGMVAGEGSYTASLLPPSYCLKYMQEQDLAQVMRIEIESFPSPWTPLAYISELRYNHNAHYMVLLEADKVVGYTGVWDTEDGAHIMRIAVDPRHRKAGLGGILMHEICRQAREQGNSHVLLEVRASNKSAVSFYQKRNFVQIDFWQDFYSDPPDDAIVFALSLQE